MRRSRGRPLFGLPVLLLLSACASPQSVPPRVDAAAIQAEQAAQQRAVVDTHLAAWRRVEDLSWPLRAANTELCGDWVKPELGLRFADADRIDGLVGQLRQAQIEALGWDRTPRIAFAIAGGPAAEAGIATGDVVLGVEGGPDFAGLSASRVERALADRLETDRTVALRVRSSEGAERTVTLTARDVCSYPSRVVPREDVNASAGSDVTVTMGMARWADDDGLRFVLAHEMAHVVLDHRAKLLRNGLVTGLLPVAVVGSVAGSVADLALGLVGLEPKVPLARQASALAFQPGDQVWEREADYVGLYFLARAGYGIGDIDGIFARLAEIRPGATWVRLTHPPTPERRLATRAARDEILAKLAAGEPLIPNGMAAGPAGS